MSIFVGLSSWCMTPATIKFAGTGTYAFQVIS